MCRSDVLTAQVAKATNTRHMSFWLKVNEVRGPRSSPRKEACPELQPLRSGPPAPDTSVCGHACPGSQRVAQLQRARFPGFCLTLQRGRETKPTESPTRPVARSELEPPGPLLEAGGRAPVSSGPERGVIVSAQPKP